MVTKKEIKDWLEEKVEYIKAEDNDSYGYYLPLDDTLMLAVYFENGFDPEDEDLIHCTNKEYCLVACIKLLSDAQYNTLEYCIIPYDNETGEVTTESVSISNNEDYDNLTDWLYSEYEDLRGHVDEEGKWHEDLINASVFEVETTYKSGKVRTDIYTAIDEETMWMIYDKHHNLDKIEDSAIVDVNPA